MKIVGSQILQKAVLRPRSLRMTHPPHPLMASKLVIKNYTCTELKKVTTTWRFFLLGRT